MFSKSVSLRRFGTSAMLKCSPTKAHKCLHPKSTIMVQKNELLQYFENMNLIRKMEIKTDSIYKSGLIRGFCHLYDGQEAVAVGIEAGIKPSDHLITAYRCHAQQLLRGDSVRGILAEMLGKKTGTSKGKGGSMHLYMPQNNFHGGNGIVGAQIPVGAGIAFANKYKNNGAVTVAMMGDGAANQGQVYETTNMAALWKLPLILLVENNKYGMGTSAERSSFCTDYYTRGHYVPGIQCDGLDVVSVRATMEFAAEHCRSGKGPIFVEMRTYRYHGHSMSDPGKTYRDKEEVKTYRKTNDAVKNCKNRILELEWATEEELKKIEKKCSIEVEEAAKNAMADEEAHKSDRFVDIYYKEIPKFIRGTDIENSYHRT